MSPVLQSIVEAAVAGTGSTHGWIVSATEAGLTVAAATGPAAARIGERRLTGTGGTAGFVVGSGQPLALTPRPGDPVLDDELVTLLGEPLTTVICVPCSTDQATRGALQVMNKVGGGSYSFDDVELATLLATVAGSALESSSPGQPVRSPADLSGALSRLADADGGRYARVAVVIDALLDGA